MLSREELAQLRGLVDELICASSKTAAKKSLRRLEFAAIKLSGRLDPYVRGKLNEVISHALTARGEGRNKAHWISCVDTCWSVFEARAAGFPTGD